MAPKKAGSAADPAAGRILPKFAKSASSSTQTFSASPSALKAATSISLTGSLRAGACRLFLLDPDKKPSPALFLRAQAAMKKVATGTDPALSYSAMRVLLIWRWRPAA
jgi:hypothetical protein